MLFHFKIFDLNSCMWLVATILNNTAPVALSFMDYETQYGDLQHDIKWHNLLNEMKYNEKR